MGLKGRNLLTKLDFRSSRSHRTCLYKCGDACSKPVPNTSNNTYFGDLMDRAQEVAQSRPVHTLRAAAGRRILQQ